jgi:hypothetical protein
MHRIEAPAISPILDNDGFYLLTLIGLDDHPTAPRSKGRFAPLETDTAHGHDPTEQFSVSGVTGRMSTARVVKAREHKQIEPNTSRCRWLAHHAHPSGDLHAGNSAQMKNK